MSLSLVTHGFLCPSAPLGLVTGGFLCAGASVDIIPRVQVATIREVGKLGSPDIVEVDKLSVSEIEDA